jgi:hypothetical protein
MPNPPPDPVCKAILLCQKTIVEEGTGLVSLISVFDGFGVTAGGGKTGPAELFCRITEAHGKHQISVEIQELASGYAVAGTNGVQVEVQDPLAAPYVVIPIPSLPLCPGQYDIVIFANKSEIDRQKVVVYQI